jgi:hypothetical protein
MKERCLKQHYGLTYYYNPTYTTISSLYHLQVSWLITPGFVIITASFIQKDQKAFIIRQLLSKTYPQQ